MTDGPQYEPDSYIVRYGGTRLLGEFSGRGMPPLRRQSAVIIRTERGTEWGTVLGPATTHTRAALASGTEPGRILRLPNASDEQSHNAAAELEREAFNSCLHLIREVSMQMVLVDTELLLGGERIIFYYVSEQRVDFRELVKLLARKHKARIEMRQIGVRDEAKMLADYGDCGKPVCCNTHLREMPPVSMKMAKMQKATLDPNKISGRCGRLKCCLRYEYDTYEEHRKQLPPIGSLVVTAVGTGKVIGQELLAKKLMIAYEGQGMVLTSHTEIQSVLTAKGRKGQPGHEPHDAPADETDEPEFEAGNGLSDVGPNRPASGNSSRPAARPGDRPPAGHTRGDGLDAVPPGGSERDATDQRRPPQGGTRDGGTAPPQRSRKQRNDPARQRPLRDEPGFLGETVQPSLPTDTPASRPDDSESRSVDQGARQTEPGRRPHRPRSTDRTPRSGSADGPPNPAGQPQRDNPPRRPPPTPSADDDWPDPETL